MKTNTFKKIFSLSFLLILAFSIVIPLQSLAAEPTVNLSVVSETQDGGTGNWNWIINVKTTNMPDGTTGFIDLYEKGKLINEQKDIVLKNNSVTYYTPKSFLNSGTTYSVVANFWINEKYVGNKFFSRTTPKSNVSDSITESVDRTTAIGAAITPPSAAPQNPTTVIGQTSKSTDTNYVLLAPIGKELTSFESDPKKNPCAFGNYLNIIIKIFFGICAVLAMLMIIMGGIQYMTSELISSKEAGKESITHAIFGFLLAVSAYLILNTLNPDLLNACLDKLPEASITIDRENDLPQSAINGKFCTNTAGANGGYSAGADWASIAGNKAVLPTGSSVYNSECKKVGDTNCTSTLGLNTSYINKIISDCPNCKPLLITGGTECWLHGFKKQNTSHHPKSSTIDLNPTDALNKYVTDGKTLKDWTRYQKNGMTFLKEPSHWHVGQ